MQRKLTTKVQEMINQKLPRLFLGMVCTLSMSIAQAVPINLLANSGFETGDFTGWTVGGNTPTTGVATDDTLVAGDFFGQGITNVRSGDYSAYYLTQGDPILRIILSQTVSVLANQIVDVGFYVGHGQGTQLGGRIENSRTQIFIDGIGLLSSSNPAIPGGTSASDFLLVSGSFNTGARTSISVSFAIDGSGTGAAINSVDDFYFISEAANGQVPEPATLALMGLGLAGIGYQRRRSKKLA